MAFLLYERATENDVVSLRPTGEKFMLAGRQLLYRAWLNGQSPANTGWEVTADDLIRIHTNNAHNSDTRALIIDWAPRARDLIGIIELVKVYAYTYVEGNVAIWTPLMCVMRDKYFYEGGFTPDQKADRISCLQDDGDEFIEFLYLQGEASGWSWGKNGMTNAAFLMGPAREYFRAHF